VVVLRFAVLAKKKVSTIETPKMFKKHLLPVEEIP
jgi:hypothetical protein